MMKRGIDLSHHNVNFNFLKHKDKIEFAILRAGYGQNNDDREFKRNVKECERYNIPFGVYWFSYAYTPDMAKREADYCCNKLIGINPTYPVVFDFEYGSVEYARKHGYELSGDDMRKIAEAFLSRVEERGYFAMLYTNKDFIRQAFEPLLKRYALWLAEYNVENPSMPCSIWQYGIDKDMDVDGDYCYKDFPEIITNIKLCDYSKFLELIPKDRLNQYYRAAMAMKLDAMPLADILASIRTLGLDPVIFNTFVNNLEVKNEA